MEHAPDIATHCGHSHPETPTTDPQKIATFESPAHLYQALYKANAIRMEGMAETAKALRAQNTRKTGITPLDLNTAGNYTMIAGATLLGATALANLRTGERKHGDLTTVDNALKTAIKTGQDGIPLHENDIQTLGTALQANEKVRDDITATSELDGVGLTLVAIAFLIKTCALKALNRKPSAKADPTPEAVEK